MGVAIEQLTGKAASLKELACPGKRLALRSAGVAQSLGDRLAERAPRVKRRGRVLEHHLYLVGTARGFSGALTNHKVACGGLQEPGHALGNRRLAAARLAHKPQHLARQHVKRNAVHDLVHILAMAIRQAQVAQRHHRLGGGTYPRHPYPLLRRGAVATRARV